MPEPHQLIGGRYRLSERVGTGAHGAVWKAQDERLARAVAIKIVDVPAKQRDPGVVARFRREAQTAAGLNSPNVVAMYDSGEDGSDLYLVMELLGGPNLATLIADRERLSLADGFPLAEQVAAGLVAAHAAGIVHRDLKPANVVLNQGTAKIVDFGIARFTDTADATMTSAATVSGTAAYMSPEQASGQAVHASSDMYAFGCLLWTMFVGTPPFAGDNAVAVASAQVNKSPQPFSEACPGVPTGLAHLVDQLLSKDPSRRPTADQVQRQLRTLSMGASADATETAAIRTAVLPVVPAAPQATPPPPSAVAQRPRRSGSGARWLLTIALAIAIAALGWLLLSRALSPSQTPSPTTSPSTAVAPKLPTTLPTTRPASTSTSTSTRTSTTSSTSTTTSTTSSTTTMKSPTTPPTSTSTAPTTPTGPAAAPTSP